MTGVEQRIVDLQVERVTSGLGTAAQVELDALAAEHGDQGGDQFELAAAVVDLAFFVDEVEPLPSSLRKQLEVASVAFLGQRGDAGVLAWPGGRAVSTHEAANDPEATAVSAHPADETEPARTASSRWTPWLLAAAALVAAVLGWARPTVGPVDVEPVRVATLDEKRALLLEADDAVSLPWTATEDAAAAGVSGDVVWSPARQRGFMRFRGLPANDPGELQYQLWIFDATRDDRYPIDGGVFDVEASEVTASGDVLVPIRAVLPVRELALFAVTIEPPGGVVVSSRERIVTLAQVS